MPAFETVQDIFLDDLDAIGVLHNSRHMPMFERALVAFWRHLGWQSLLDYEANPDALQVVRENRVEYLRPAGGVDRVRVRLTVSSLGRTSITYAFVMLPMDGEEAYSKGTRVMVKVDRESMRPVPFSSGFRAIVSPWIEQSRDPERPTQGRRT